MKKQYIIPIFVPHLGCPNDCIFCNQKSISGQKKNITKEEAKKIIDDYLKNIKSEEAQVEIAFYGGSFTAIETNLQEELLEMAYEYIKECLALYEKMLAEDYHSQIDFLNIGANPYDGKKDKIINIEIYANKLSIFSKEENCSCYVNFNILTALRGIVVPTKSNNILDAGNMKVFSYHHKVQEVLTLFEYHQNNKGLLKRVFLDAIKQLQEKGDIRLNSHREENGKEYYDYETDLNVMLR